MRIFLIVASTVLVVLGCTLAVTGTGHSSDGFETAKQEIAGEHLGLSKWFWR